MALSLSTFLLLACHLTSALAAAVQVTPPTAPPSDNVTVVYSNFFGISLELSFINFYFGNDSSSIPQPMLNYLAALRERSSSDKPVRLRLGGNSMDSSTYVPGQTEIIKFTDPNANVNDQPVSYGGTLFDVMKASSDKIGVQWLIGLSLRDANSTNTPLVAGDAQKALGDDLDAFLLGNEPDLYTAHGNRPNLANYTTNDYIGDYWVAFNNLNHTPQGDVLSLDKIAGPTICCFWDLSSVLTSGWLNDFQDRLKYITLQHYPQNNCDGHYPYHLDYYMSHTNSVNLARWQEPGLQLLASTPAAQRKPVLMDEFNSASCGGIPESGMFGMALWTADYALQMASVGYSGAYIHTRERGVTYNLFDPPDAPAGGAGPWTTHANFYAMLAVTEALQDSDGSKVVDLNLSNSVTDYAAVNAGYAIYNSKTSKINRLALFNYANASAAGTDYTIPASIFDGSNGNVLVRYLTAPTATETTNIAWGNQTYAGTGDGTLASTQTQWSDKSLSCSSGCTIQVPGPGMAVVFIGDAPVIAPNTTNNGQAPSPSNANPGNNGKNDNSTGGALTLEGHGLRAVSAMSAIAFMMSMF